VKKALEFCAPVCAVLTFLRDKSRAPAAILFGALNTYGGILPPVERSGQGCPENWQPRWLSYKRGKR